MSCINPHVESWNLEETNIRPSFRRCNTFISPAPATPVHFTCSSIFAFSAIIDHLHNQPLNSSNLQNAPNHSFSVYSRSFLCTHGHRSDSRPQFEALCCYRRLYNHQLRIYCPYRLSLPIPRKCPYRIPSRHSQLL